MRHLLVLLLFISIVACQSKKTTEQGQPLEDALYLEDLINVKSHDDLIQRFGKANVKRDSLIPGPEGSTLSGTLLFPNTSDQAEIYWADSAQQRGFQEARVLAKYDKEGSPNFNTRWLSRTGVRLGMTLDEVQEINAQVFELSGFGWDYGGYVTNWQGGNLADKIRVRFVESDDWSKLTQAEMDSVSGDRAVKSSNPALRKIRILVAELGVFSNK